MVTETRWERIRRELREASEARNFQLAEEKLAELWAETNARDEVALHCNTHSAEGILRDAQDRFDEAEAAFSRALALDPEAHGPYGVPETLHSVALVRTRRLDLEGALSANREALEFVRKTQPVKVAQYAADLVRTLLRLQRLDDALAELLAVQKVVQEQPLTPAHDLARLDVLHGQTLQRMNQTRKAFEFYGNATTFSRARMQRDLAEIIGGAWFGIHHTTSDKLLGTLACWYASHLGHAKLRDVARAVLTSLPDRAFCQGDPAHPRIAVSRGAIVCVTSTELGMVPGRVATDARPGDAVDLEWTETRELARIIRSNQLRLGSGTFQEAINFSGKGTVWMVRTDALLEIGDRLVLGDLEHIIQAAEVLRSPWDPPPPRELALSLVAPPASPQQGTHVRFVRTI